MQQQRILLKENQDLYLEISKDIQQWKPVLSSLKRSYESLEISDFTDTVFKTLVLTGTKEVTDRYIYQLNEQLDALNIKSSLIRENSIKSHSEVIEKLNESLQAVKTFRPVLYSSRSYLTLKFISFENGIFIISDTDKENILESNCRIYIESKEDIEAFEKIKILETAFNNYLEILNNSKIQDFNKFQSLVRVFKINHLGKAEISPESLKGLLSYKERFENNNISRV